jgi:hypothetical protein
MTIDESARRIGSLVWTERRLFELAGGWVATTQTPALKVALAESSRRFGEHAIALGSLLPETRDHTPEALVEPDGPVAAALADVAVAESPEAGLGRLLDLTAAAHLEALGAYLDAASPLRDAPGVRVVTAVLADDRAAFARLRDLNR